MQSAGKEKPTVEACSSGMQSIDISNIVYILKIVCGRYLNTGRLEGAYENCRTKSSSVMKNGRILLNFRGPPVCGLYGDFVTSH